MIFSILVQTLSLIIDVVMLLLTIRKNGKKWLFLQVLSDT